MKLDELEIYGVKYIFNVLDDSTDIILEETFVANKHGYSTIGIKRDFIPAEDSRYREDTFAPENRWY